MESFHWDSNFFTGLSGVDREHQHLVDMINQFGNLLAENKVVFSDVLCDASGVSFARR